jgi:hypothetical protein
VPPLHLQLKPDQAALGGLVHQIGVLPILTYAEEHNELLSDPVSLNHVIDSIHPLIGDKLLSVWEFPEMLVKLPGTISGLFSRIRSSGLHRPGANRHGFLHKQGDSALLNA